MTEEINEVDIQSRIEDALGELVFMINCSSNPWSESRKIIKVLIDATDEAMADRSLPT